MSRKLPIVPAMSECIPNSIFTVAQEIEDQINDAEQMGEQMQGSRQVLAHLLRAIYPSRPILMGKNEAMKEILRRAEG